MGWFAGDETHEGYLVGLVFDDGGTFSGQAHYPDIVGEGPRSGRLRELGSGHDTAKCVDSGRWFRNVVTVYRENGSDPLSGVKLDGHKIPLQYVKVGCTCGWRSPLIHVHGAYWVPCCVMAPEAFEEKAARLWEHHNDTTPTQRTGGYSLESLLKAAGLP